MTNPRSSDAPPPPPLRVCLYTKVWRPSGSGRFAQELALGMLANGAEVCFLSPEVDDPRIETETGGLTRIRPPREQAETSGRASRILASLRRIMGSLGGIIAARRRARVFLFTIPDPLPVTILMLLLLRLSGAKVVFIAHDPLPHAFRLPPKWRWMEIAAHGLCYRLSSAVVVLSEASRDRLRAAFPQLDRPVEVIDHGVFPLGEDIAPSGDGQLLCFGTVRRNKHVLEAIAGVTLARSRGADVRLLVAGEAHRDEADYARVCQQMADEAGGSVEVRLGYLDDAELPQVMAACDAFLMPYGDFHSQSGVALLAASNGWPLIATDAGGLATLIAEGMPAQRISAPVSAESVADAVAAFRAVPIEDWRRQAAAYQALTLEKRSWSAIGARYLALCGRL